MIINFFVASLMVLVVFYIWNTWSDSKFSWRSFRTWILIFIMTISTLLNYFNINNFLKIFSMTLIFIFIYKFLFQKSLKKSISAPVIILVMYLISESIFTIFILIIKRNGLQEFMTNYFGKAISNFSISIFVLFLNKLKVFNKIFVEIDKKISDIDEISAVFLGVSVIYIYSIFSFNIYYKSTPELLMVMSAIISLLSFVLVYLFIKARYDYYKISNNYNNSLASLKELENALTNHRIDSHENKNQLMTIRNMTKSKKIISFIDTILNNKIKDDKRIMKETSVIPAGGLRGLVYSKILLMDSKQIDYELDVSNSVYTFDMLSYDDNTILDICKIVGIFLDNAIEEVDTIDEKYIVIEMYIDDGKLVISITNSYDNTKDKSNIYKEGVTTKGGNHGYGLSLVKKIVKNNSSLKTYNEINETEFIQTLIIN